MSFIRDARVAEKIESAHAMLEGIEEVARVLLTRFVMSLESDDEVASLGSRLQFDTHEMSAAKEIFAAMSARWLAVGEPVLREFEKLIAGTSSTRTNVSGLSNSTPTDPRPDGDTSLASAEPVGLALP